MLSQGILLTPAGDGDYCAIKCAVSLGPCEAATLRASSTEASSHMGRHLFGYTARAHCNLARKALEEIFVPLYPRSRRFPRRRLNVFVYKRCFSRSLVGHRWPFLLPKLGDAYLCDAGNWKKYIQCHWVGKKSPISKACRFIAWPVRVYRS